ncbi:hypothetical protein GCM10022631_14370 [Deinococcus rubellus]|uniref:MBL fold metallo-hydrolase n=1 Tax=Deinococcus rubellus TaxID=1889240 RepID=UPI0031E9D3F7
MTAAPETVQEIRHAEVDPRIRIFQAGEDVDTFAVLTRRFAVLIDTMSTPALMRQVVDMVRPELAGRPLMVVNTHADWDHVYGNVLFTAGSEIPALIVASALTRDRLRSPAAQERLSAQRRESERFSEVDLVAPDVVFEQGLTLDGGDLTLELFATPGHTPDHHSVWIPEIRTLLAGDAAEFPFPSVRRGADLPEVRASLERMAALRPAVVLPCHGGTTGPELLEQNLAYFERLKQALRGWPERGRPQGELDFSALPPSLTYENLLKDLNVTVERVPEFYRRFHSDAVRATLEELGSEEG